ncbi:MAG TPA: class I SAM-dependent methyltransferase [Polyangiaceae bacterium]|nr:class I SAM-dependent methyltransferase [Polyangiaceae bacterium]HYQ28908.1 class I SAM-dependent methyltransferase [Polyangiaceae bacterium]
MNSAWNPHLYDDRAAFVSELASDLVLWLRPGSGEKILDLGCGTGTLTAQIARAGAQVTGVDRSREMIESARAQHAGIRFEVADGQELAYDGQFTAVFSNAALHWMPRAKDVLRGVERALLPGGRFVAEFGGAGCVQTVVAAVASVLREWEIDPAPYLSWFFPSPGRYAGLLEECGFVVRELRYFERPTPVAGADGLSTWLALFQAGLKSDLGERWPELCQKASERCHSALFRDDQWWLDYVRLRVVATKP